MLDSFGLEVLHRDECIALLGAVDLGRVVFTHRGLPAVQPVRFVVRGEAVLCGAPGGSALFAAANDNVVAFEAEVFSPDLGSGWFVTVLGRAGELRDQHLAAGLPELTWRPGPDDRHLRIPVEVISGRRLG
ncbi:pyridoxamine 5'-phosphate oxidase family protein [Prauserella flavalba]|uniref:Pyridoxamine 5'-phosphate oxidase n=1 Tax=Prauserella flavalba TaxID=1477506 RepID=A0A318LPW5_9PSEU|nr:pyridoxamine 5'-phosphate oxidase family protein [Prauserella flavalba]PXY35580.1 hypothetical protein BA062_08725 [Prauserella flavalba]